MEKIELKNLHEWFSANRRAFPWREDRHPYRVWVSEVMLQQTRASVVAAYFLRWMRLFPDVQSLACAPLEQVIKAWEGLGYYSRARNLHAGARQIVERFGGEIPACPKALASIPGLGEYTIGAILAFGFAQRAAAVDGNVLRVMSRYLAIEENVDRVCVRRRIASQTLAMLDEKQPWVTSEAFIELGATICKTSPDCALCPIQKSCLGRQKGIAASLPIKNAKALVTNLFRTVVVLESKGRFLVRKGPKGKIMADLYEFPHFDVQEDPVVAEIKDRISRTFGIEVVYVRSMQNRMHAFTKYKARLYPVRCTSVLCTPIPGWEWVSEKELRRLPFSAGHRLIADEIIGIRKQTK